MGINKGIEKSQEVYSSLKSGNYYQEDLRFGRIAT